MANILMEDCIMENVKVVDEVVDDEMAKVEIDNKKSLGSFANLFDKGPILFFTRNIHFLWMVKQRLRGVLQADYVQDVYVGPHGLYNVVLVPWENKEKLLKKLLDFMKKV